MVVSLGSRCIESLLQVHVPLYVFCLRIALVGRPGNRQRGASFRILCLSGRSSDLLSSRRNRGGTGNPTANNVKGDLAHQCI
jgi:hypothetical protein